MNDNPQDYWEAPIPENVTSILSDSENVPAQHEATSEPSVSVQEETALNSVETPKQEKCIASNSQKDQPSKNTFNKPKKYRASYHAVIPHLFLVCLSTVLAFFPNVIISFIADDISTLSEGFVKYLPYVVTFLMLLLAIMVVSLIGKQLSSGTLIIFDEYVKYKNGFKPAVLVHYSDIRAVEVQRSLSSLWSNTGDLVFLHSKGDFTLANVLSPFDIKEQLNEKIITAKSMR